MDRVATEEQLATEVSMLVRLVKAAVTREAVPGAGPDRSALLLLFPLMHAPQRPGALAGLSHADPSTISRQVAELVRRGLVRREPDPSDGRASLLAITDAGREACQRMRTLRRELFASAVAGWSDAELGMLASLLSRFNMALDSAYGPPPPTRTPTTIAAGAPAGGAEQELA
jgi:DNA-binding MarR family transcriptional regulator